MRGGEGEREREGGDDEDAGAAFTGAASRFCGGAEAAGKEVQYVTPGMAYLRKARTSPGKCAFMHPGAKHAPRWGTTSAHRVVQ